MHSQLSIGFSLLGEHEACVACAGCLVKLGASIEVLCDLLGGKTIVDISYSCNIHNAEGNIEAALLSYC